MKAFFFVGGKMGAVGIWGGYILLDFSWKIPNVWIHLDPPTEVDPNSPQFDVEQAHLSFVRQTSDVDSTMPSLRRCFGNRWFFLGRVG